MRAAREYEERKRIVVELYAKDPNCCMVLFARRKASAEQDFGIPICIFMTDMIPSLGIRLEL